MTPLQINKTNRNLIRRQRVKPTPKNPPLGVELYRLCQKLGFSLEKLRSPCRKSEYVVARIIVAYGLRKKNVTLEEITRILGKKNHATVSYYISQYEALKSVKDKEFMKMLNKVK